MTIRDVCDVDVKNLSFTNLKVSLKSPEFHWISHGMIPEMDAENFVTVWRFPTGLTQRNGPVVG